MSASDDESLMSASNKCDVCGKDVAIRTIILTSEGYSQKCVCGGPHDKKKSCINNLFKNLSGKKDGKK